MIEFLNNRYQGRNFKVGEFRRLHKDLFIHSSNSMIDPVCSLRRTLIGIEH